MLLKLLQLNIHRHGPITQAQFTTCHWTSFSMQSVLDPKCIFQKHLHQRVPNIQGQRHGGVCFTHSLCFIPVFFTTNIRIPKIHKLLKLPELNLSETITHAHSTTFPHVLCVIRSILLQITSPGVLKKREANPIALHVVPNQHLHLFPIFYTL